MLFLGGVFMGAGPLFRLLHLEGDTYSRYAGGGWYSGCAPAISPDGTVVVYSSPRSGRGDIFRVRLDGTGTRQLTSDPLYEAEPTFSPDGRLIAYVKQIHDVGNSYRSVVFVMNSDGSGQRQLTRGSDEYSHPVFTPDGKTILCERSTQHVIRGTVAVALSNGAVLDTNVAPGWDAVPTGKSGKVVYVDAGPSGPGVKAGSHYIWRSSEGPPVALAPGWSPAVSPDGTLIVGVGEPYSQTLWIMNADGTNQRKLYDHDRHYLEHPTFTPDSRHVLFHEVTDRGVGQIMVISTDGKETRAVESTQ